MAGCWQAGLPWSSGTGKARGACCCLLMTRRKKATGRKSWTRAAGRPMCCYYMKDGKDVLIAANREIDEVAMYRLSDK